MANFKRLELDLKELLLQPKKVAKRQKQLPSERSRKVSMYDTVKKLPKLRKVPSQLETRNSVIPPLDPLAQPDNNDRPRKSQILHH